MRATWALAAFACLGLSAAAPAPATAQSTRTITCESRADERNDCYVGNLDVNSVSLDRKLSKSACNKGSSWGTSKDNIWVSQGCRATFSYRTRSGGGNWSGNGGGGGGSKYGTITCESRGNARNECYVANLDESSVTMDRKLSDSPCVQGRSWGTSNDNIWVSQGCRATFAYVRGGGNDNYGNNNNYGGGNYGNASMSSMKNACIQRASDEWAVTESNLEIAGSNRLDNGQWEFVVRSKRTSGSCYVDSNGRVRKLSTY
jgi:hypothetical protein